MTPRLALPFPARKGSGRAGALGAGPLAAGWNSSRAARDWPVRHRPEPLGLSETDPTPASFLSLGKRHTFLEGCDSVPGDCTFISDSRLFETDGLLCAWLCVCVCVRARVCTRMHACVRAADVQIDSPVHAHMNGQMPVGRLWVGLGPSHAGVGE